MKLNIHAMQMPAESCGVFKDAPTSELKESDVVTLLMQEMNSQISVSTLVVCLL